MKLYKYYSVKGGIATLRFGRLRLSPPNTFNDPFEFGMNVDYSAVSKDGLKEYLRTSTEMFNAWREIHAPGQDSFSIRRYYDDHLDEIVDERFAAFPGNVLAEQEKSCDRASKFWAVTCFCENHDSILMWSHYAEQHEGMLIEFDSNHLPFHNDPESLVKVRYSKDKPVYIYKFGMEGFEEQFQIFSIQKHIGWQYEQEWRMIIPQKSLVQGKCAPLFVGAVKAVTFGCRCKPETQQSVLGILKNPILGHIKKFRAKPNQTEYKLDIVEMPD